MEELPSRAGERGLSRLEEYKVPLLAHLSREHPSACCGGTGGDSTRGRFLLGGLETVIEARLPVPSRSSSRQHASLWPGLHQARQCWLRAGPQVFKSPLLYLLSPWGAVSLQPRPTHL